MVEAVLLVAGGFAIGYALHVFRESVIPWQRSRIERYEDETDFLVEWANSMELLAIESGATVDDIEEAASEVKGRAPPHVRRKYTWHEAEEQKARG